MPSAGYSHFYTIAAKPVGREIISVSMPSAGYSHFYGACRTSSVEGIYGVNALGGLFSFLLGTPPGGYRSARISVSMPSAGYSHFYGAIVGGIAGLAMCQCPRRAILISTISFSNGTVIKFRFVSMPSAGYSHFYENPSNPNQENVVCQCPRRAILISTKLDILGFTDNVSMPSAGYSHFYLEVSLRRIVYENGVNALGGLFSFLLLRGNEK